MVASYIVSLCSILKQCMGHLEKVIAFFYKNRFYFVGSAFFSE